MFFMKFKIVLINILILFLILLIVLLGFEFHYAKKWGVTSFKQYWNIVTNTMSVDEYFDGLFKNGFVENAFTQHFREDMNVTSPSLPILLCGCSFTWGEGFEYNETVSYQLANLTGRPVYNRAGRGWGLSQFLYLTGRDEFYNIPEPEYLIYIFIEEHRNRLDRFKASPAAIDFQPKYKVCGNRLVPEKPRFYDSLFSVADFKFHYNYKYKLMKDETLKLYFAQAEKEIRKHWKNTKLVILVYPLGEEAEQEHNNRKLWIDLEKENNYIIIFADDLTNVDLISVEYRIDGWHPTPDVWRIILPKLIEVLNI